MGGGWEARCLEGAGGVRGCRQGRGHVEVALGTSRVPGTPGVSEELPCPPQNSVALASIQLPPSLFSTPPAALAPPVPPDCTLQLLIFRNGRLFRTLGNTSRPGAAGPGRRRGVATPVIFAGTSKGLLPALRHCRGGRAPALPGLALTPGGRGRWLPHRF